jgi:translation initiation factor RLI1
MGEANVPVLNTDCCFGSGVCATGCPQSAIAMINMPYFPTLQKTVKEPVSALKSGSQERHGFMKPFRKGR